MNKIHAVTLEHDKQKEWESQVAGLSFKDAGIINRLVAISMKVAEGGASPGLVEEASRLNDEFLESDLSWILANTFGTRFTLVEHCAVSPEIGHS